MQLLIHIQTSAQVERLSPSHSCGLRQKAVSVVGNLRDDSKFDAAVVVEIS
jgi:hypothetical protein